MMHSVSFALKGQDCGDSKKVSGCKELKCQGGKSRQRTDVEGGRSLLHDTLNMFMCHYTWSKPTECTTPRVNVERNHGLGVMMCHPN